MADYSKRRTMMVDTQVRPSDVTKFPIIDAMLSIPREAYVPAALREAAYVGENLAIGNQRSLLDPRTLAKLLDALDIQPTDVVLDIGTGLGYSTAVIARLAEFVVSVESEALAEDAQNNLSEHGVDNAAVMSGDLAAGAPKSGPYDVIILQGAVEEFPTALLSQLKEGGKVACIFAEGSLGTAKIGYKSDTAVNWRAVFNAGAPVLQGFERQETFAF